MDVKEQSPPAGPAAPGVLVVDDEPGVRKLLREVLTDLGLTIWEADGGAAALDLYRQFQDRIVLVLLDVRMAGLDGPNTLARLQAVNAAVPCCFMTGHAGHYTEEQLLRAGALAVVRKPFRLAELLALVRRVADQRYTPPA